jgi:hypothetical protein
MHRGIALYDNSGAASTAIRGTGMSMSEAAVVVAQTWRWRACMCHCNCGLVNWTIEREAVPAGESVMAAPKPSRPAPSHPPSGYGFELNAVISMPAVPDQSHEITRPAG